MPSWIEREIAEQAEHGGAAYRPLYGVVTNTIYANSTGDDDTGNGTVELPFRTFQRALRSLPHNPPPAHIYDIDCSEAETPDVEVLPPQFQMPAFHGTTPVSSVSGNLPFSRKAMLNIRATPLPLASITLPAATIVLADIDTVVGDPVTGITTITLLVARPSWAADALKGTMLVSSYHFRSSNPIISSTTTTIEIANTDASFVMPSGVQTLIVSEQSKVLQTSVDDAPFTGMVCGPSSGSICWQGIKFTDPDLNGVAIRIEGVNTYFELCDIAGFELWSVNSLAPIMENCIVRDGVVNFNGSSVFMNRVYMKDLLSLQMSSGGVSFLRTVVEGCQFPISQSFSPGGGDWYDRGVDIAGFIFCEVRGSVGSDVEANGAVRCRPGGTWNFYGFKVSDSAGDGISVEGPVPIAMELTSGEDNAGFGLAVRDGGQVRVFDDGTDITGDLGDMKVGSLSARTWADFRTALPGPAASTKGIKNEYDLGLNLAGFPVGDEVSGDDSGGCSGSRVFQRPIA